MDQEDQTQEEQTISAGVPVSASPGVQSGPVAPQVSNAEIIRKRNELARKVEAVILASGANFRGMKV